MNIATPMTDRDLQALLSLVRAGDQAAFEQIYIAMKTPVYTVALRILGDRGLAEDTVQEVFIKLYRQPPPEDVRKPRAYLFRMARNSALDALRRQSVRALPLSPEKWESEAADTLPDAAPADGGVGLRLDIERAMARLSDKERRIVTLHIHGALKFREIAALMELPLGTVLGQYRRAIGRLRELLAASEE
ncbi:MAG: RNA polymerase sigma factor [Clostridia bacterium]|nr:RNA polymerase sigma factor [Clostridia bacterium]